MFDGLESRDKDPRKSLHVDTVPPPAVGPGEALIAVMASAINYNTVWTSIFEPVPTFKFLARYGRMSDLGQRHDLPYHVVGSDAAGVVLRTGPGVRKWRQGDEIVAHCLSVELEDPQGQRRHDARPAAAHLGFRDQRGAGRACAGQGRSQLMPKPGHPPGRRRRAPRPGQLDGLSAAGVPITARR
jgi:crotonyl-CoA reductase